MQLCRSITGYFNYFIQLEKIYMYIKSYIRIVAKKNPHTSPGVPIFVYEKNIQ